jgi:gliding motility-associated-like protein
LPAGWSGSSTTGSITVTAGTAGGTISVTANGLYDTSTAKTLPVIVNPLPVVAITANGVNLNATSGFDDYQWLLNNQFIAAAKAATYIAAASGNYAVIATDHKNCKDTSDIYILKLNTNLFVPNMFSPNGDSNNDLLKVYGNQLAALDFMVFNQWGQKVYESHDVNSAWDGRSGGQPQPVGVYMYTLKVVLTSGEVIHKKGAVSLIR